MRASLRPLGAPFAVAIRHLLALCVSLLILFLGAPASAGCSGDCDGDGAVNIDELVLGVNIGLGILPLAECPAMDGTPDGSVGIDDLVRAVNAALGACAAATPTPTVTTTPTPTEPAICAGVPTVRGTSLRAELVVSGLSNPLYVTAPPGDVERIFVVEQRGRIRIVESGRLLSPPFLDLTARVVAGGERGLLSLAFHPDYERNGEFFVDYTMTGADGEGLFSVVSRFRVSENADRADPGSEEILLEQRQPWVAHNGGQLFFDGRGYLYVTFGDGGESATRQNNAQDGSTWLGKILRIDPDGGVPYAIPPDNPFAGDDGVLDEIWALGFRNPWRASFDAATGNVYAGDVGESSVEEIDVLPPGGGANLGWCCREGSAPFSRCYQAARTCPAGGAGLTPPVVQYGHDQGCSVTGGFVYRGCALPDLRGTYFYGDFCAGFVRSFVYRGGAATDERDWTADLAPGGGLTIDRIAGFGEDARGELYVCDFSGGEVYRIVPAS